MYHPWSAGLSQTRPPLDRPVWVDLDVFYGAVDPATAPAVDDPDRPPGYMLKATGKVPGPLKRWLRAVDGRWFGNVTFSVCDSYGAIMARHDNVRAPWRRGRRRGDRAQHQVAEVPEQHLRHHPPTLTTSPPPGVG